MADAVALAQKGYAAEEAFQRLKAEREHFVNDAKGFDDFVEYRNYLKQNPALAARISETITAYDTTGKVPALDMERAEPASSIDPQMKAYLDNINRKVDAILGERQISEQAKALTDAIAHRPVLAEMSKKSLRNSKGETDVVLEKLVDMQRTDPRASLNQLADALATELALIADPLDAPTQGGGPQGASDGDRKRFRQVEPGAAGAGGGGGRERSQDRYGAEDLENGNLRRDALKFLDAEFGDDYGDEN